jgi:hypothetical protein
MPVVTTTNLFFISTNFAIYPAVLAGFAGLLLFLSSLLCVTLLPLTLTLCFELLPTALNTLLQTVYACLRRRHGWLGFDGFDHFVDAHAVFTCFQTAAKERTTFNSLLLCR